jgi:Cu(I)/Ag(I) efflux system membrane fusion protein
MFVRAVVRSNIASGGRVLDASLAGKWISPMHPEIVKDGPGNCDVCGMPLVRAETLGYVTAEPTDSAKPLVIPVSAALITGMRAIVYVQVPAAEEPTYEGREIVLGSRAGDYYLVRSGLREGELVVTNGNFKLDSALQISAKPSMMTPEGGGGSGHNHGASAPSTLNSQPSTSAHSMSLPQQLQMQLHQTIAAAEQIGATIESAELETIRGVFDQLGKYVAEVNAGQLSGEKKALLQEFTMLLRNDAVEGSQIKTLQHADEVFLVTKRHLERLQEAFGLSHATYETDEQSLSVPEEFRTELSRILPAYLSIGDALASDDASTVANAVAGLNQAVSAIDSRTLSGKTAERWQAERDSLCSVTARLASAKDITALRSAFALLSDQLLTLERSFGFQNSEQLFELHCPMAFEGRGATWIQADSAVRNPYYGATMLKCADRVESLGNEG